MDKVELKLMMTPDEAIAILKALQDLREPASDDRADALAYPVRETVLSSVSAAQQMPTTPPMGNAPTVAPSVPAPAATASEMHPRDNRGVVWHPEHHSGTAAKPGTNADGSWKKRHGYDAKALKAYEARFLGKSVNAVVSPTAPTADVENGAGASVTSSTTLGLSLPTLPQLPTVMTPPPGTPGVDDLSWRWADLVQRGRVNADHEAYIVAKWGGHPVRDLAMYATNPVARKEAYDFMKRYE